MSANTGSEKLKMHIDPTERSWMRASVIVLVVFAIAITVAGFMLGIQVPTEEKRVDPGTIASEQPWAAPTAEDQGDPRVQELVPGSKYAVYITAQMWLYSPNQIPTPESGITIPKGAEVTFYVTSKDVQHGFRLQGTNVNFMVIPGQVSTLQHTFDEAGTFDFICTEYCGTGHAAMYGSITISE
jgi:cytochrome c oxidase subunit 2